VTPEELELSRILVKGPARATPEEHEMVKIYANNQVIREEPIEFDVVSYINTRVNRVAQAILKAEDELLKNLFREAFEAGIDTEFSRNAPDFEEWWSTLIARLREEQNTNQEVQHGEDPQGEEGQAEEVPSARSEQEGGSQRRR